MNRLRLQLSRRTFARIWRGWVKLRRQHLVFDPKVPSSLKVDVVSPLAEKDLSVFPETVYSVRKYLLHPIGTHYVVAPRSSVIVRACKDLGCEFIDERGLCPAGPERFAPLFAGLKQDRSKWLYQQILKLSADALASSGRFITIDSDTLFIRPVRYELNGRLFFDVSDGYREDLDPLLRRLMPHVRLSAFSYMCHIMLLESTMLEALRAQLATAGDGDWIAALTANLDVGQELFFSEFELYANFALSQNPHRYVRSYWYNIQVPRARLVELPALVESLRHRYKSVSLHEYANG